MEALLKESGKLGKGLRAHFACLYVTSALLLANFLVLYELTGIEVLVVERVEDMENAGAWGQEFAIMPLASRLLYSDSSLRLPTQTLARCAIQAAFSGGVLVGLCLSWVLFAKTRPKAVLVGASSLTAVLVFVNGFVPFFWPFVGLRFLVGLTVAWGQTAVFMLILDWSHASNQVLAVHTLIGTRVPGMLAIAVALQWGLPWRRFFFLHPCGLVVAVVLDLLFVQESPRWLRTRGKLSEFRETVLRLAGSLGKATADLEVFADDFESRDPARRAAMPRPAEIVQLLAVYALHAFVSLVLQGSVSRGIAWPSEVALLAGMQGLAFLVTAPLYRYARPPLAVFSVSLLIVTIALLVLPHDDGILFATLLQTAKFNAAINDHFAIFFTLNLCAPPPDDALGWPARTQREWRARLLLGLETLAMASRTLAVFFVLQERNDSVHQANRISKLSLCLACLVLELVIMTIGRVACFRKPSPSVKDPEEKEPMLPDPSPEPEKPDPSPQPQPEKPKEIVIEEEDVIIDL